MKLFIFILFPLVVGCFAHWESPSEKLATQADNYLDNERDLYFYKTCSYIGKYLNCLNNVDDFKECSDIAKEFQKFGTDNIEKRNRFIRVDGEMFKEMTLSGKSKDRLTSLKNGWETALDQLTEQWPDCREIAEIQ